MPQARQGAGGFRRLIMGRKSCTDYRFVLIVLVTALTTVVYWIGNFERERNVYGLNPGICFGLNPDHCLLPGYFCEKVKGSI
jgi:hypothetical protein